MTIPRLRRFVGAHPQLVLVAAEASLALPADSVQAAACARKLQLDRFDR